MEVAGGFVRLVGSWLMVKGCLGVVGVGRLGGCWGIGGTLDVIGVGFSCVGGCWTCGGLGGMMVGCWGVHHLLVCRLVAKFLHKGLERLGGVVLKPIAEVFAAFHFYDEVREPVDERREKLCCGSLQ